MGTPNTWLELWALRGLLAGGLRDEMLPLSKHATGPQLFRARRLGTVSRGLSLSKSRIAARMAGSAGASRPDRL